MRILLSKRDLVGPISNRSDNELILIGSFIFNDYFENKNLYGTSHFKVRLCSRCSASKLASYFQTFFAIGSKPIKAFCELPRGVTQIGESTTVAIGQCPTLGCFSQEFDYQTPMDQVVALLESSSECHQTLEFQCFLAPLDVSFIVSYNLRLIIHPMFSPICFTIFFHEFFSV